MPENTYLITFQNEKTLPYSINNEKYNNIPEPSLELNSFNHSGQIFVFPKNSITYKGNKKEDLLPVELSHIEASIEDSEYILDLEYGWDEDKAVPIPQYIYNRAIAFIKKYSISLFEKNIIIVDPTISPLSDGSIDILWETKKNSLLVNIKNTDREIAYYYGISDIDDTKADFNGKISTNSFNPFFASWLKEFQMGY